jgi:hypothetical protein
MHLKDPEQHKLAIKKAFKTISENSSATAIANAANEIYNSLRHLTRLDSNYRSVIDDFIDLQDREIKIMNKINQLYNRPNPPAPEKLKEIKADVYNRMETILIYFLD